MYSMSYESLFWTTENSWHHNRGRARKNWAVRYTVYFEWKPLRNVCVVIDFCNSAMSFLLLEDSFHLLVVWLKDFVGGIQSNCLYFGGYIVLEFAQICTSMVDYYGLSCIKISTPTDVGDYMNISKPSTTDVGVYMYLSLFRCSSMCYCIKVCLFKG